MRRGVPCGTGAYCANSGCAQELQTLAFAIGAGVRQFEQLSVQRGVMLSIVIRVCWSGDGAGVRGDILTERFWYGGVRGDILTERYRYGGVRYGGVRYAGVRVDILTER